MQILIHLVAGAGLVFFGYLLGRAHEEPDTFTHEEVVAWFKEREAESTAAYHQEAARAELGHFELNPLNGHIEFLWHSKDTHEVQ